MKIFIAFFFGSIFILMSIGAFKLAIKYKKEGADMDSWASASIIGGIVLICAAVVWIMSSLGLI